MFPVLQVAMIMLMRMLLCGKLFGESVVEASVQPYEFFMFVPYVNSSHLNIQIGAGDTRSPNLIPTVTYLSVVLNGSNVLINANVDDSGSKISEVVFSYVDEDCGVEGDSQLLKCDSHSFVRRNGLGG